MDHHPPKVVTYLVDAGGPKRTLKARQCEVVDGALVMRRGLETVAIFAPGCWSSCVKKKDEEEAT